MKKPLVGSVQSFELTYKIKFITVPADYYFICKWLSDTSDFYYNHGIPVRLFHFQHFVTYTNITYLTKSPHAQTKYGTHVGTRVIHVSGSVGAISPVAFLAFVRQLTNSFAVQSFSVDHWLPAGRILHTVK